MRSYSSTYQQHRSQSVLSKLCCSSTRVYKPYRSVLLLLLWTTVVGGIYSCAQLSATFASARVDSRYYDSILTTVLVMYTLLTIVMVFYPLGGFLADVYFGRYRVVIASLIVLTVCMLLVLLGIVTTLQLDIQPTSGTGIKLAYIGGGIFSFALLVIGLSGYTSNIVQLGMDQLLDVPCHKLGVFVHWLMWSFRLGNTVVHMLYSIKQCTVSATNEEAIIRNTLYCTPASFLFLLSVILLISYFTRKYFNTERVKYNPYKMIVKVLNFARKNKYPVGPTSAFAYCDDRRPSRIDYAKERYGGPFTTSDVEDVKTFIRVLLVLLALGAVFVIEVPTSFFLFSTFSLHTGTDKRVNVNNCTGKWVLLETGNLSSLLVLVIIPVYIWVVYSILRNRVPKILHRLCFAIILFIMAVFSMLVIDFTGHVLLHTEGDLDHNVTCMFVEPILYNINVLENLGTLNLHWAVLILPNILKSLAPDLIMATTLEFISAQSPNTMKGVLVGMLFAIRGLFQLIGAVVLIPFTLDQLWKDPYLQKEPPVTNCGFGYFLLITAVAMVGLILFSVASKRYKYRRRGDEPYSQSQIEDIFSRRIEQRQQSERSRLLLISDDD